MSNMIASSRIPVIFVTAGDENYGAILKSLVRSIRRHPQSTWIPIVVFDLGIGEETRKWLTEHGARCVVPDWDHHFDPPLPNYFKAMVSRPHLPKYVPEAEIIVWLDADTWVQDWRAIEMLIQGAKAKGFAIVPECDRSYTPIYNDSLYISYQFDWIRQCFNDDIARNLFAYPLINCGVFAARVDAPHWNLWSSALSSSFGRKILFVSEQTVLNVVLRTSGLPFSQLPSTCNWICFRAPPLCSDDGTLLLTPELPHEAIGIVHLAGYSHKDKCNPTSLITLSNKNIKRPLSFLSAEEYADNIILDEDVVEKNNA